MHVLCQKWRNKTVIWYTRLIPVRVTHICQQIGSPSVPQPVPLWYDNETHRQIAKVRMLWGRQHQLHLWIIVRHFSLDRIHGGNFHQRKNPVGNVLFIWFLCVFMWERYIFYTEYNKSKYKSNCEEINLGVGGYSDHFVYTPSQWETTLRYNVVSHWLGVFTKWSLGSRNK